MPACEVSVVVPVFNEEPNLEPLWQEVRAALLLTGEPFEVLFVDDGSSDGTSETLARLSREYPQVCVLTHEQNRGQGAALYNGMKAARGSVVVTIDGDRQNDPVDIPEMLAKLVPGIDLVVGIRQQRQDTRLRKTMSRVANFVRSRFLGDHLADSGCALKVMRRGVVDAMIPLATLYSFVPALAVGGGFSATEIPVRHRERTAGTSNYGLLKMLWRPFVDMVGVFWYNHRRSDRVGGKSKEMPGTDPGIAASAAVLLLIALAYFALLGNHGLLEPDEGRYGEVAREMHVAGNYLVPSLNGFSHVEKPPLVYWLTAAAYRLFGVNEFSARLPSTLAALGTIWMTYLIGACLLSRRAGIFAALILASCLEFFFLARTLTPDMTMCLWISGSIAALLMHHQKDQAKPTRWSWLFFICAGLGFLTKGPVAFLVPACSAIGLWLGYRHSKPLRGIPWLRGTVLAVAIGLSWFIAISIQHPELWRYFVQDELVQRITSSNHGRSQPIWFFVPIILAGFLPWTFFMPALIKKAWRARKESAGDGGKPVAVFLFFWICIPFVVLSLSGSKLLTYILPLLPGLAVATGILLSQRNRPPKLAMTAMVSCAVWLIAVSLIPRFNDRLAQQATIKPLVASLRSHPDFDIDQSRIIASNIRAHGLEFYLGRTVEITRGQADLILKPPKADRRRLHRSSKSIANDSDHAESVFVVTRTGDHFKIFGENKGWQLVDTAGDFVLLCSRPQTLASAPDEPMEQQTEPAIPSDEEESFLESTYKRRLLSTQQPAMLD